MRKVLLVVLAATLSSLSLATVPAGAKPVNGNFSGCYTIRKSGNYNQVSAGATITAKGKNLRVHGFVAVTPGCQKANSTPIDRLTIVHTRLRNARTGKVVRLSPGRSSRSKSVVRATTAPFKAKCGVLLYASVKISYAYSDGSYVHPFWIQGHRFRRC